MRIGKIEVKRRVWVGLGCAVVATAAWAIWTRDHPPASVAVAPRPQPFVRLAGEGTATNDQILRERAGLFDPTPLFFPTDRNFGQRDLPDRLRPQPDQVFGSYGPKLTVKDQNMKVYGVETGLVPEKPIDVLNQGNEAPFAGMGHLDLPRPETAQRVGFLEVRSFKNGQTILQQSLNGLAVPRLDYAPLEFIVSVSAFGLVGEPVLASGSGWEEVDAFFQTYLVKRFRLGQRLSPGHYRVWVGP